MTKNVFSQALLFRKGQLSLSSSAHGETPFTNLKYRFYAWRETEKLFLSYVKILPISSLSLNLKNQLQDTLDLSGQPFQSKGVLPVRRY